ncbi:lectin-like [Protopterus annectens]|uniref:lectin-like n=1 Tax=Protopterus annectens TaxID=7888 RepID=UPI001CFBE78C|nr:lectin-like [Protopterus annectens]
MAMVSAVAYRQTLTILLVISVGNKAAASNNQCKDSCMTHWEEKYNSCYRFFPEPTTWRTAEDTCIFFGGNLASLHNEETTHFLIRLTGSTSNKLVRSWIGGKDMEKEGTFVWTDGTHFSYENWAPSKPDGKENENCLTINSGEAGQWNDADCAKLFPYICSYKLL